MSHNFFQGKTLVITGSAGQFGSQACSHFLALGVNLAALDITKDGLDKNCPENGEVSVVGCMKEDNLL